MELGIFRTLISRLKPPSRQEETRPEADRMRARRRWKRTLLLVPFLVGLFYVAAVERGHPANGKPSSGGGGGNQLVPLADPSSLFAERSPGERGAGALLSTKPAFGPHERVLASERERDPGAGASPPADDPVFGVSPNTLPAGGGDPGAGAAPGDPDGGDGSPFGAPAGGNFGGPQFLPRGLAATAPPGGGGGVGGTDPGLPGIPGVPEPATWAMMILGFFGAGTAIRRRTREKTRAACAQ
jgi:PEP-CTERM motif